MELAILIATGAPGDASLLGALCLYPGMRDSTRSHVQAPLRAALGVLSRVWMGRGVGHSFVLFCFILLCFFFLSFFPLY